MTQADKPIEMQSLLQQGSAALEQGDRLEALKHFRQATERDPESVDAWLGMADAVRPYRDQQTYLRRAQALDPSSTRIQERLAHVEAQMAAGEVLAPRIAPPPVVVPTLIDTESQPAEAEQTEPTTAPAAAQQPAQPPPPATTTADEAIEVGVCYRHPDRETGLRCVQCNRFICTDCVRPAFVGQLCPECAEARRPVNYKVSLSHILVASAVTLGLSLVGSWVIWSFLPGWFLGFIIAFVLGPLAAEGIIRLNDLLTHNKRGRKMQLAVGLSYAVGASPWILISILLGGFVPFTLLFFTGIAILTIVTRLR
jgi:hypothetical protein